MEVGYEGYCSNFGYNLVAVVVAGIVLNFGDFDYCLVEDPCEAEISACSFYAFF
jgi:hypothetical protein